MNKKDARLLLRNALASVGKIQMLNMLKFRKKRSAVVMTSLCLWFFVALALVREGPGACKGLENAVVYLPNCLK